MSYPSLNDRDALLESAGTRLTNTGAYKIVITPSAENFSVNAAGAPAVAVLDLTATFIGLSGPVTWAAQNGTISNVSGANNANAQLAFASVTGSFVKVTASVTYAGRTYSTERIIGITKDGAGSYTWTKYSNSSNGASMQDSPTGMSYIGQAFNKPTATPSTSAADYTWTLFKGADANKNHTAFLYQWSTSAPAKPNGSSTFTWASGVNTAYAGTDNWKVAPDANPGTPGVQLFTISAPVSAAPSATTTTVSVANYAAATVSGSGQNGANGITGLQALEVAVYQWAATIPAGPTGAATLVWASQAFGAAPTGWSLTPGTAATPGMTRWKARVLVTDSAAALQTNFSWTSAAIVADGYAGTNGTNGTAAWVEISTTSGQVFSRADTDGTFAPASITLTATQYGPGTATYLWQYWDGTAWVNAGSTAATLAVASGTAFAASRTYRVQMTVGGVNYYDEMTLVKVTGGKNGTNGTSAIVGFLTNESATVPASNTGTVAAGDLSAITGTFKVFEGVVDKTGNGVTYSVSSETGVDVSINPTTGVYSIVSFGSDQGAAVLQAVYDGVTIQKVFSLAKAKAGTSITGQEGVSYVTAYCASLTATTTTAPANTTGRNSVPVVNGGGITGTWGKTVPSLSAGQYMWQVDGLYNPATDQVIWSIPYWSSLKVGTLSAIVANLGAITGGSIDIGTGAASWHVDATGNTWAGAASYAAAPYRVSNTGAVVASNIAITGGKLDIGSGNASFHVDPSGNFWSGATSYESAPFRVSNTGAVRMSAVEVVTANGKMLLSSSGEFGATVKVSNLEVSGSSDNIIPDPRFKDLAWWGRVGSAVGQFAEQGMVTDWKGGASLYLSKNAGELISYGQFFDLVPGATYRMEIQVALSNDFNGRASVYLTIPGDRDYAMVDRDSGLRWSDNMVVQLTSNSPKGVISYSTTYTIPVNGTLSKGRIQIRNSHTVGNVEVGSVSITRMADANLVVNGAVTAEKIAAKAVKASNIDVDTLAAIIAYLGNVELGAGGALRQGKPGYGVGKGIWIGDHNGTPKLDIGETGGAGIIWDGFDLIINRPKLASPFSVTLSNVRITQQVNGSTIQFSAPKTITSGSGNYAYSWSFSASGPSSQLAMISSPAAQDAVIKANASNSWLYGYLALTLKDLNSGLTATSNCEIVVQFGSGVEP